MSGTYRQTKWGALCVAIGASYAAGQCFPRVIATFAVDGSRLHTAFDGTTAAVTNPYTEIGQVELLELINGQWQTTQVLIGDDTQADDAFGNALDISGPRMVIGAYAKEEAGQRRAGAAYVFEKSGDQWQQVAKLLPSDGGRSEFFGEEVAIRGDRVIVSSRDDSDTRVGAVYVFDFDGSGWTQTAKVQPNDLGELASFGHTLALWDDRFVAGAPGDDEVAEDAGALYVFELVGGNWNETTKLFAPDAYAGQLLGFDPALWASDLDTIVYSRPFGQELRIYTFEFDGQSWSSHIITDPVPNDDIDFFVLPAVEGDVLTAAGFFAEGTYRFDRTSGAWAFTHVYQFDIAEFSGDFAFEVDQAAHSATVWDLCGAPCTADWDGNLTVDTRDVIAYLNAWNADDPDADLNGDGNVDTQDVTVFLGVWAAGC